jgi:hypothetical protein
VADDSARPPVLSYDDVAHLIEVAAREPPGLTLIGGQALNFWAQRYLDRAADLQDLERQRPFLSGDLDFIGPLATVLDPKRGYQIDIAGELHVAETMAEAVHGKLEKVGAYGPRATLATLTYREQGEERLVHFLGDMLGVKPTEVARTAIVVHGYLRVMNPVVCMESRLSNVLLVEDYRNVHGRHQARASIICAREYVRELLDQGHTDRALDDNNRIFKFAKQNAQACLTENFAPFDAFVLDDRLPEKFRSIHYPRMVQELQHARNEPDLDRDG